MDITKDELIEALRAERAYVPQLAERLWQRLAVVVSIDADGDVPPVDHLAEAMWHLALLRDETARTAGAVPAVTCESCGHLNELEAGHVRV